MVESGDAMPLNEVLSGRTVVIFVGQDKVKWTLPENLLCKHNDFFKKALRGPFMEKDAVINLPDDDPNAFGLFVQWIYALTLKSVEPESIFSDSAPSAVAFTWIFADMYNDRALQDHAITKLHALSQTRLWTEYLYVEEVNHVFEHTQESAPIRTLIARWIAWNSFVGTNKMEELNAWETILRAGNQAVSLAIMKELCSWKERNHQCHMVRVPDLGEFLGEVCDYHLHGPHEWCRFARSQDFGVCRTGMQHYEDGSAYADANAADSAYQWGEIL